MTPSNKIKPEHILVLPRWYPNKTDIQLGIFIQRQILLMQTHFKFSVVYAQAIPDLSTDFELITNTPAPNVVEHIVYFKSASGPLRKIANFKNYKKAQALGLAKIKEEIDLCHVHVPYRSAIPALRLLKKKGTPFLVTEHWSGHLNGAYLKKNALDKRLYCDTLKKAKNISTVSHILGKAFKENTGFDSVHIPNYIEQNNSTKVEKDVDYVRVLSVSDLDDKTKNVTGLINAFFEVWQLNRDIKLTIVGGGPDKKRIEDKVNWMVDNLAFSKDAIQLIGRKEHAFILKAMTACDFYICNSNYETFGMTVAEALLAGKPVVSTKCGGPEEFLHDKNSIRIDLPGTHNEGEQLIEAITTMSKTYQNYDSEKISAEIKQQFGKEVVQKKWLDFYTT